MSEWYYEHWKRLEHILKVWENVGKLFAKVLKKFSFPKKLQMSSGIVKERLPKSLDLAVWKCRERAAYNLAKRLPAPCRLIFSLKVGFFLKTHSRVTVSLSKRVFWEHPDLGVALNRFDNPVGSPTRQTAEPKNHSYHFSCDVCTLYRIGWRSCLDNTTHF